MRNGFFPLLLCEGMWEGELEIFPAFFCLGSDAGSAYTGCVTLVSVSLNPRLMSVTRGDRPTDPLRTLRLW